VASGGNQVKAASPVAANITRHAPVADVTLFYHQHSHNTYFGLRGNPLDDHFQNSVD
jgi:hypothetical protein